MTPDEIALPGNTVRAGAVGLIAADPFLARELGVRLHDFTGGVSRSIVLGDADAVSLGEAVDALEADASTRVLLVGATAAAAAEAIERLAEARKPAVLCVLGADAETKAHAERRGVALLDRSKPAALAAAVADGVDESTLDLHALNWPLIHEVRAKLDPRQRYVRGLFLGSAQCAEAALLTAERHGDVHANLDDPRLAALEPGAARGHAFVDFGQDPALPTGAPPEAHPAIRAERLVREASDPEVAVIVLDFALGADAHPDPVGVMLHAIAEARRAAEADGRHLELLGYVLGTELDPQHLAGQLAKLDEAGVTWASSATNTGLLAREFVSTAMPEDEAA